MSRISIAFYSFLFLIPRGLVADTEIFTSIIFDTNMTAQAVQVQ
jgi:hypothetical protein